MYREKIKQLERWATDPFRKPLLLYGARQVGKTYLARELFAKKWHGKYLYIDLASDGDTRRFIKNHINAGEIIQYLSLKYNTGIDENTLLIFDEIQECLPCITALKYFCQDYRKIPVIATGSMVRIRLKQLENTNISGDPEMDNDDVFLFPVGKIDEMSLYPLTFSEFLLARNERLHEFIKTGFRNRDVLDTDIHEMALHYFFEYMIVGGMPEPVDLLIQTNDYQKALQALKTVYNNYMNDMSLYQISNATLLRTHRIFENVYTQLAKENKNFKIASVEKGKRLRDYYNPIDWLCEARIIYPSYQCKERVTIPLREETEALFRLYLSDCGLFAYQSGISPEKILHNEKTENSLSGIYFENYVADELVAHGHKLFFWKGKTSSELEFLVEDHENIIPIDAKKNKGSLKSLDKYRELNPFSLAVKVSQNNYGYDEKNRLLTLPYYYFTFWLDSLSNDEKDTSI